MRLPLFLALLPASALACTLWGAAGSDADGGTLLSKNRDWKPDHRQVLRMVRPTQGHAYFGIFAEGNDDPGLKAGVNEHGLSIVSASSSIPKLLRKAETNKHGIMRKIMTNYKSIDSLLPDADNLFARSRANFFLLADHRKLLVAEVGLEGKFAYTVVEHGTTAHTNHYLVASLAGQFKDKPGASSITRLARINKLLAAAPRPLTTGIFVSMSRDHRDGPNNSLWRNGREFTLASWIIATPTSGAPHLRVVIANPGEAESTQDIVLDQAFWRGGQLAE